MRAFFAAPRRRRAARPALAGTQSEPLVSADEDDDDEAATRAGRQADAAGRLCPSCRAPQAGDEGDARAAGAADSRLQQLVAAAVLTSPKLTESEVEAFAKMGNVTRRSAARSSGRTGRG